MKTSQRIPKAIVVVAVVGIGLLHNMENKSIITEPFREMATEFENVQLKSDTLQTSENQIFTYTKSFINSTIQHLISKI